MLLSCSKVPILQIEIIRLHVVMKLNTIFLLVLMSILGSAAFAQAITDDELKKYAIAMDSISAMTDRFKEINTKISRGNEKVSNIRYNQLVVIIGDSVKLKAANATPDEIAYVKKGDEIIKKESAALQKNISALIGDYLGSALFAKVRNALKTDEALRKRYESISVKKKA